MSATTFLGSIATAALLMTAGAAEAREPAPPAPASAGTANPNSLSQRYCIVENITGSRIPRRACASLAEWQVRSIDPRNMRRVSSSRSPFDQ